MKFQTKVEMVTAVQWLKDGDHSEVESRAPKIVFDLAGNYFYVARFDQDVLLSRGWLAVDPAGEVAQKNGDYLPFAFYSLRSGVEQPVDDRPDLLLRYAAEEQWATEPVAVGFIKTPGGNYIVYPGDWIVTGESGDLLYVSQREFAKKFEPCV